MEYRVSSLLWLQELELAGRLQENSDEQEYDKDAQRLPFLKTIVQSLLELVSGHIC